MMALTDAAAVPAPVDEFAGAPSLTRLKWMLDGYRGDTSANAAAGAPASAGRRAASLRADAGA